MAETTPALLAEFVGTFMVVFTAGCITLSRTDPTWAPTSIACTLMVMIYCFGPISGGHLNPSVTLAAGLSRKLAFHLVVAYIAVQLLAGIIAAYIVRSIYQASVHIGPRAGYGWWEAAVVEALYTGMIAFVVLSVTSKRNNPTNNPNQFYALAIGFVVIAGGYGAGPISGACFNPAVSLGLDIASRGDGVGQGFLYFLYEAIGSVIAALVFRLTRPEDFKADAELANYKPSLATRLASEFVGVFMVVLTIGLNTLTNSTATAWSAAAAVMCMIYSLGDVCGGHFNPAVTLAVALCKRAGFPLRDGIAYIVIQLVAGVLASLLYAGLHEVTTFPLAPKAPYTDGAAYVLEVLFTFVLAFTVLSTAVVKGISTQLDRNYYFALAIGSCVTAGGLASGSVSGGSLNPAASFGIAISHTLNYGRLYYCLTYFLAEMLGGLLAAVIFFVTHAKEFRTSKPDQSLFSG